VQSMNRSPSMTSPDLQHQGLDEAVVRPLPDLLDLALDPPDALALALAAQVAAIERGVDVVGVVHRGVFVGVEPVLLGGLQLDAVVAQVAAEALRLGLEPEVVELAQPGGFADLAERVDVAVADLAPVLERDAQLEGRLAGAHELGFVEIEQGVEGACGGDGRLPHPDGADLVGLDQGDVQQRPQLPRQGGGGHPAGRAAAGDHHFLHDLVLHAILRSLVVTD
jgi:hypothetical protein